MATFSSIIKSDQLICHILAYTDVSLKGPERIWEKDLLHLKNEIDNMCPWRI